MPLKLAMVPKKSSLCQSSSRKFIESQIKPSNSVFLMVTGSPVEPPEDEMPETPHDSGYDLAKSSSPKLLTSDLESMGI